MSAIVIKPAILAATERVSDTAQKGLFGVLWRCDDEDEGGKEEKMARLSKFEN